MRLILLVAFVAIAVWSQNVTAEPEYAPTVELKSGQVRGLQEHINGQPVYLYKGIRFGHAKRFASPQPVEPWTGVYNATKFGPECPQANSNHYSEDCLFVNVWQPADKKANRDVMFWIHGGGFLTGAGHHDSRYLATAGDVVVVSVQYRLGAFGFLYGGIDEFPGNLGLRDQILGLQWVQENIHHFGGDPKKVTIFGQSAGSMSVGALVLSPMTKSLFHRAILMSGAPNSYLGSESKESSHNKTLSLLSKFMCIEASTHGAMECLRRQTAEKILAETNFGILNGESFIPIHGEQVMPLNPISALKTGKFNTEVDIMFGVTSGEGSNFVGPNLPFLNAKDFKLNTAKVVIKLMYQIFKVPYYQEVVDFYTKEFENVTEPNQDNMRRAVSNAFADYHITCPEMFFAEAFNKAQPKNNFFSYRVTQQLVHGCQGWEDVCHAEDNAYIFTDPARHPKQEHQLSVDMVGAWSSFAKTGNPGKMGQVEWKPAFDGNSAEKVISYMNLHAQQYRMVDGFYKHTCDQFWKPRLFA